MIDIAVIDYGMGNLRSVAKAIEHVASGCNVIVTSDPDAVRTAERVVFPVTRHADDLHRPGQAGR